MSRRNHVFISPGRDPPFAGQPGYRLDKETVDGPLSFFNPTTATFHVDRIATSKPPSAAAGREDTNPCSSEGGRATESSAEYHWRARDNRKGRHTLVVDGDASRQVDKQGPGAHATLPPPSASLRAVAVGIRRIFTECPYWDVSYLVAVFFAVGCAIFIMCGLFYWLPIVAPGSHFKGETIAGDVSAFIGATLFQIGAVLLVFEACNENQTGCFGWALHRALRGGGDDPDHVVRGSPSRPIVNNEAVVPRKDPRRCGHHHQRPRPGDPPRQPRAGRRWSWWPTWYELRTHYIHEIGFLGSIAMTVGATVFYICGICSLPGIYSNMSLGVARGVYWLTYLVGGALFILSSAFYLVETQPNWYTPAPFVLGWHIGFWNMVGSVGWTLSASFGYCTASWCDYQGQLTLIWASAAFFIGSMLLWYEALDKYPVETKRRKTTGHNDAGT